MPAAKLTEVMRFFGFENAAQFRKEWSELTPEDQAQLRTGIADGTLTY